jgi:NRPS condensation-like uncharacterized protein
VTETDAIRETYPADLQAQIVRLSAEVGCAGPVLLVLTFDHHLDAARLTRAARLLLDAEPMLGCRYVPGPGKPHWRRRHDLDDAPWCVVHEAADVDAELKRLMTPEPGDIERTFLLHLLRRADGDTLVMWVTHMLADAFAAREIASLLAGLYTRLGGDPAYRPETNRAPPAPDAWARNIPLAGTLRILRRDFADALEGRGMVHSFERDFAAFSASPARGAEFVKLRLGPQTLAGIDRAARSRGSTRNELLTAAFLRVFPRFASRGPAAKSQVALTIDLRRFTPPGPRLRTESMVGMTRVTVPCVPDQGFDDTLARVKAVLARQKKALMGAANPLLVRIFELLPPRAMKAMVRGMIRKTIDRPMAPSFSNAGRLDGETLRFDGAIPVDAGIVVFPAALPLFMVTALEFAGTLTLTCCFQPTELSAAAVREFLEGVVGECPTEPAAAQPLPAHVAVPA